LVGKFVLAIYHSARPRKLRQQRFVSLYFVPAHREGEGTAYHVPAGLEGDLEGIRWYGDAGTGVELLGVPGDEPVPPSGGERRDVRAFGVRLLPWVPPEKPPFGVVVRAQYVPQNSGGRRVFGVHRQGYHLIFLAKGEARPLYPLPGDLAGDGIMWALPDVARPVHDLYVKLKASVKDLSGRRKCGGKSSISGHLEDGEAPFSTCPIVHRCGIYAGKIAGGQPNFVRLVRSEYELWRGWGELHIRRFLVYPLPRQGDLMGTFRGIGDYYNCIPKFPDGIWKGGCPYSSRAGPDRSPRSRQRPQLRELCPSLSAPRPWGRPDRRL